MLWFGIFQVSFADEMCLSTDDAVQHSLNVLQEYFFTKDCTAAIKKLQRATSLSIVNRGLTDISFLKSATRLTHLNLAKNNITDTTPLADVSSLLWLDLSENPISSMKNLPADSLEVFWCRQCQISSWEVSAKMSALREISLRDNQMTTINISDFPSLQVVFLTGNQITDPSSLAGIKKMTAVDLYGNPIDKDNCPQDKETSKGLRRACSAMFPREE